MRKFYKPSVIIIIAACLFAGKLTAQSVSPFTLNMTGGYTKPGPAPGTGYYQLEWSVGEMTMIETFTTPNFVLTQGVLQPCTDRVTKDPLALQFHNGEYAMFPNPTTGKFEFNLLLNIKGQVVMQLVDAMGRVIETREFHYDGCGRIERFDIGRLPDGIYVLHTTMRGDEKRGDGILVTRNSGFRIAKLGR